jgi:hypothetical protein
VGDTEAYTLEREVAASFCHLWRVLEQSSTPDTKLEKNMINICNDPEPIWKYYIISITWVIS